MRDVAHHQRCVATGAAHQSGCEPYLKRQAGKVQTRNLFGDSMRGNRQAFTIEQKIRYFSTDAAPVSLGIVFDISHSMERKLDFAKDAAVRFLQTGTPDDEYFLVEFSSRARLAEGFTSDIRRLRDTLRLTPAEGATALYDAVYLGLSKLKGGQNPKKALLLITDGEDNHSRYSRREIRQAQWPRGSSLHLLRRTRVALGELDGHGRSA